MTGSTDLHRAIPCIEAERDAVADRASAFDAFARRVRDVPTDPPPAQSQVVPATPKAMATAVRSTSSTPSTGARCVTVREAFAETVGQHSIAEDADSVVETMAAELTEEVAVTLAAETGWTPALKSAVLEEVATQRRKAELLDETLQNERRAVESAIDLVEEIVAWLQATAEESLLRCDFETLRTKHERLEHHRDRLETLTETRQEQFADSVARHESGGYRALVTSIYSPLDVRYPVLSTAIRLYEICDGCQRTIRAHLTRRV